jgi:hypothetical protein
MPQKKEEEEKRAREAEQARLAEEARKVSGVGTGSLSVYICLSVFPSHRVWMYYSFFSLARALSHSLSTKLSVSISLSDSLVSLCECVSSFVPCKLLFKRFTSFL